MHVLYRWLSLILFWLHKNGHDITEKPDEDDGKHSGMKGLIPTQVYLKILNTR